MERLQTRLWRGGLSEIMKAGADAKSGNELKRALETEVDEPGDELARSLPVITGARREGAMAGFEITRIMNDKELGELRQVQRAASGPVPELPVPDPVRADAEVRELAEHLGLSTQRRKRLAMGAGLVLLAVGGWCAQRASATNKTHVPPIPMVAQKQVATHEPVIPAQPTPVATPVAKVARAPRTAVPARSAVDALAAGEDLRAAALYRELATQASDPAVYLSAAEILEQRRNTRRR